MSYYQNPFSLENQWDGNQLGDPYIMRHDGYYYLYCSSHRAKIKCWRSENLVDWDYMGSVCDLPEIDGAYAPEVFFTHGRFYMVTSPKGSGHYLLVSESPMGPFALASENFGLLIDGSLFADDDGKLYFTRAGHRGIVIHDVNLPNTPQTEGTTIPESFLNHWTEGSMIIKRDGHYFMTMTGNHLHSRGYRVDYIVSKTAPNAGYTVPRNPTLLLETGDEFHGLGHSSTVLGPDMDSYYIAYHSFNFLAQPRYRSMNIDRLFFDGGRMYVNAAWWQQPVPDAPVFSSRGGKGLKQIPVEKAYGGGIHDENALPKALPKVAKPGTMCWMTPPPGGHFTSELNINPKGKPVVVLLDDYCLNICSDRVTALDGTGSDGSISFSRTNIGDSICSGKADSGGSISFGKAGCVQAVPDNPHVGDVANSQAGSLATLPPIATKPLPPNICLDSHLTIRIAQGKKFFRVWINGMCLLELAAKSINFTGKTGIGLYGHADEAPGFVGFSHTAEGSGDDTAQKNVPGRFLAAHNQLHTCPGDGKQPHNYCINVKHPGEYSLFLRLEAHAKDAEITVNDKALPLANLPTGRRATVCAGTVALPQGVQTLTFTSPKGIALLDEITLIEHNQAPTQLAIIQNGQNATKDLRILGHKQTGSMIRKEWGFTCAENHGAAYIGQDGWTNYTVKATINTNLNTNGTASLYLRATKESWFEHQATPPLLGYRVKVAKEGITLSKCHYGEKALGHLAFCKGGAATITVKVTGETITVHHNGNSLTYIDQDPYPHGKVGLEATGEGWGFEYIDVEGLTS